MEEFKPGTVKPEADYLEIERLGAKLGIPVPMMYVKVEAKNPDGSGDVYQGRSRTVNRNFWNYMFCNVTNAPAGAATFGAGFLASKVSPSGGIANVAFGIGGAISWTTVGTQNTDSVGILVGIGTVAENFEGFVLNTPVTNGTGAGQLQYQLTAPSIATYNAGTKTWSGATFRVMNNNSAGTIVIAETGIVGNTVFGQIMFCRDLLGSTVSVLAGGQLTVTYTMTLTFPA